MSTKLKKGYALRRMFVDGEVVEPGEACTVPEGDADYLKNLGKFTTDKAEADKVKKTKASA